MYGMRYINNFIGYVNRIPDFSMQLKFPQIYGNYITKLCFFVQDKCQLYVHKYVYVTCISSFSHVSIHFKLCIYEYICLYFFHVYELLPN